jgi:hypothetical protein
MSFNAYLLSDCTKIKISMEHKCPPLSSPSSVADMNVVKASSSVQQRDIVSGYWWEVREMDFKRREKCSSVLKVN